MDDLTPGTLDRPKKWGLLDRDSSTWLGNDYGPLTYDGYDIARIAARLLAARLNSSPGHRQGIRFGEQETR